MRSPCPPADAGDSPSTATGYENLVVTDNQDEGPGPERPPRGGPGGNAGQSGGERPASTSAPPRPHELAVERTRTATLFAAAAAALVLALLMLVFVLQNDDSQRLEFLWFDFTLPTGVAMLLAAVVGGLIVASLGLGRVLQLRVAARRHRRAGRRATS